MTPGKFRKLDDEAYADFLIRGAAAELTPAQVVRLACYSAAAAQMRSLAGKSVILRGMHMFAEGCANTAIAYELGEGAADLVAHMREVFDQ